MARKGAFTDDALGDIDDLLPPTPPAPKPPAPRTTVTTAPATATNPLVNGGAPASIGDNSGNLAAPKPAKRQSTKGNSATETAPKRPKQPSVRARGGFSTPEAHVASLAAEALRQLTHTEKQQRGKGRSYGEVVLDAIEQHMDELKAHFDPVANAKPKGRLFARVDHSRPRRRRHAEPPVKIPLAGIIASDLELLDDLVLQWHTGSRSALVDQALQLYLAEDIARLSGDDDEEESDTESAAS